MEKIKLNDGTLLEIQSGATEYNISILAESVDSIAKQFTDSNLERYEILTEDGSVCAIYTNKHLKKLSAKVTDDGYLVTVVLEDVNELYERVKSLEAIVETLQANAEEEVVEDKTTVTEEEIVADDIADGVGEVDIVDENKTE